MATNYEEWLHAPNFGVTNPMFSSPGGRGTIASIRGGDSPYPTSMTNNISPASMVTTITENNDGSGSSKKVEKFDDDSEVITELKTPKTDSWNVFNTSGWDKIVADWKEKRLATEKQKEIDKGAEIIDNLEAEKKDVFRSDDNYTDWFSNYLRGERRAPRQYINGAKAPYELGPSQADQDIFSGANPMASRHPAEAEEPGYWENIFDLDRLDQTFESDIDPVAQAIRDGMGYPHRAGPSKMIDRYTDDPAVGSGVPALKGEELAESFFDQGADAMQYAQGDGITPPKGSGESALRGEELAESLSPTTQEIIATAAQEIDAAGDDEEEKERIFESVKEGLMDFSEMNPQLAKSILSTIAAMMMGSSFGDAIATGFGVHEEAAMEQEKEDKAASQEVIKMLIDNAEWINDANFWKTLEAYGITEDSEAGQLIANKWDIARDVASKKKFETNLAKELEKIDELYKEVTDRHVTTKNQAYVYDAITRFIPYAKEQLRDSKTPSFITDEDTKSGIVSAIAEYTRQVDEALEDGYYDKAASLRQAGIEAIWEGMQGSYQFVDGKIESSVVIPEDKAGLLHAQRVIMGSSSLWKNTTEVQEFEANTYAEWIKDYFGQKGKFNKEEDFVDFLAMRVLEKLQE